MSFAVDPTRRFLKELKQLRKRYASILDDVEQLGDVLSEEPHQGVPIGRGCYKVRMAIPKARGKAEVRV
jgi:mRNA-degrading endonuclease RelE of RelBE toxin-antitoxin system